ncbi:MAG: type II toxin-antitoxin system VapC family toxin [Demequina sp.]|nr:type II toxin-antitoxin system VapC family toxin [Demequina sp.]
MIILDTNVLSETMRTEPDEAVTSWFAQHSAEVATTAITVAELRYGVARLPEGVRKRALTAVLDAGLAGIPVLSFGELEAFAFATIRAALEAAGMNSGSLDVQIAAIAATGGHALATRNVKHFEGAGIAVMNPWTDG